VAAYLMKPIRQTELHETIVRVLPAHRRTRVLPLITRFFLQVARDSAAFLRALLVEDNAVNQRVAVRLLRSEGTVLRSWTTGGRYFRPWTKGHLTWYRRTCKCRKSTARRQRR
jgi:two-component system sensor histidine kinase/response regulator